MDEIPLVTSSTIFSLEHFWTSVLVYHERPNVVNRKLAAITQILFCKISLDMTKRLTDIFTWESLIYEIRKIENLSKIDTEFVKKVTEIHDKNAIITPTDWATFHKSYDSLFLTIRILFPRKGSEKCVEFVFLDKAKKTATFFAVQEQKNHILAPRFPYHIQQTKTGNLRIVLNSFEDADTTSAEWLANKLFPKLLKWAENQVDDQKIIKSLSLVLADEYCSLYFDLKTKYGPKLVEKWPQKTKTDPQKYVFEDIAIATYLICLWRKMGAHNINFVDCGCGNGLLVYILNREGFKGCGFDIRGRKTWDIFEGKADLRVGAITPKSTFPESNWLIGNHSDELTPWIPIIALNSGPQTDFFVLPCCPYDLNGQKYVRKNTNLSQYEDYLGYVKDVSEMCGFRTEIDKLRIPSTKRTCLIGVQNQMDKIEDVKKQVGTFLESRLETGFFIRDSVEKIRNCTQLELGLKKRIINLIVGELLELSNEKPWNGGGLMTLANLSQKIDSKDKKMLKNECGGLQTLVKNHRYIFDVRGGSVRLRPPPTLAETDKYKEKNCWFAENHPNGCPHQSEICAYKH